jgi:hypothetical protein
MPTLRVLDRPYPAKNLTVAKELQKDISAAEKARKSAKIGEVSLADLEIEKAILCALLYKPDEAFPIFFQNAIPDFFLSHINRGWFNQIYGFYQDKGRLDAVEFLQHIQNNPDIFTPLGGSLYYVGELQGHFSGIETIPWYCDDLRQKYLIRQYEHIARGVMKRIASGPDKLNEITVYVTRRLDHLKRIPIGSLNGSISFSFDDLEAFNKHSDPNCLIGNRWLVRGGSTLWAAGAGYGKSALGLQMAIYWGCGQSIFGLRPVRPLKSLIVQAENDLGDCAEQMQGVLAGISSDLDIAHWKQQIRGNVVIHQVVGRSGMEFLGLFDQLIQAERPDIAWIDPLFAFAGCDLLNPEKTGRFLREGLFPIAVKRCVGLQVIHHAGKPSKMGEESNPRSDIDYQYLGFGTSEIQNAFRAVNILVPVENSQTFKLVMSKRGERSGTDRAIFLEHSKEGICWLQSEQPESEKSAAGRPLKYTKDQVMGFMDTEGVKAAKLFKHLKDEIGISSSSFYRLWQELKDEGKIRCDQDELWYPK